MIMMEFLAQVTSDPSGVDLLVEYLDLGVVVLAVLGFIKGWIVPPGS